MDTEDILINAYSELRDEFLDMLDDGVYNPRTQQRAFYVGQDMQDVDTLLSVYYSGGDPSDMLSEVSDRVADMLAGHTLEADNA